MDFITGGAYNGMLDWAMENYDSDCTILQAGQEYKDVHTNILIVDKLEEIIYKYWNDQEDGTKQWREYYQALMKWERTATSHQLIMIGTDITGGIVPVEQKDRLWRDRLGFIYQQLTKDAECVFRIWFGISQQLK
ncbi:bifunctional adenosylcobinamide kinase/adenosylcobinamide-phosphate guanylyltransferase [Virgibacillus necropolis]|uniref:bifunctional adenosylcobinamide kinase/adenosylcobinamide-phosphate guanylyltransferase n=1 Tax=Virgibacillus necropolis TaxID=163877 RepID=UPI00384F09B2